MTEGLLGKTLGGYTLFKEIGSGGFGTVYAGISLTNQTVAVKVLNDEFAALPGARARLLQEAETLRLLPAHPNIVGLLNYGDEYGKTFLVMELLSGQDLRQMIDLAPLLVTQALDYTIQTARALDAAAASGLIHCDIKPENIKVSQDLQTARVMDFGIARAADSTFLQTAGTPAYMAPELWRRELPSIATDVYAMGCVLYELLAGCPPFYADSIDPRQLRAEWTRLHTQTEPDFNRIRLLHLPESLLRTLRAMLAKDPGRPPAAEVARRLEQLLPVIDINLVCLEPPPPAENEPRPPAADTERTFARAGSQEQERTMDHAPAAPPPAREPVRGPGTPQPTPPRETFHSLPQSKDVVLQRQPSSISLEGRSSRVALVNQNLLLAGALDGQITQLDLQTGRFQHWRVLAEKDLRSTVWQMVVSSSHLLVFPGERDWVEIDLQRGAATRRGLLPEAGYPVVTGSWLYLAGSKRLHRVDVRQMEGWESYDLPARVMGAPYIAPGAAWLPTSGGLVRLDTTEGSAEVVGPALKCRFVGGLPDKRLAAVYPVPAAEGMQTGFLRVYDTSRLPTQLCEARFGGQAVAAPVSGAGQVVLACQDGRLTAWTLEGEGGWRLEVTWSRQLGGGRTLQAGISSSGALIAAAPCREGQGVLVVLNTATGAVMFEQPVGGDVFIPPLWHNQNLTVVTDNGRVEVFRVSLVERRS